MKLFLIFFFSLIYSICFSQNEKVNREPFKLNLPVDTEHYYSMDIEKTPYFVKERIVQIYPGEKIYVETEIKGDTIYSMKSVLKNLNPEKTIEIELSQDATDKKSINMMLNVKNPFNKILKHNALMYTAAGQNWQRTSIIPIRPKLQNFETWGYTIITLILDEWRLE